MQNYRDTIKKLELPEWYVETVHDGLVIILTEQDKLRACKFLRDISNNNPDQRMSLKEAKDLCDFITTKDLTHLKLSIKMVIMSHLSDIQEDITLDNSAQVFYITTKINFIKFLLLKYPKTDKEINPDMEWEMFASQHLNQESKPVLEK